MELIDVSDELTFTLRNAAITYAMQVSAEGLLEQLYFGASIAAPQSPSCPLRHCTVMFEDSPALTLNELPQEYPTHGRGDYGSPAFHAVGADNSVFSFLYKSYRVEDGKPTLDGMPSSRGNGAKTLIVTLADAVQQVEVDLHYTIWPDHAVIARRVEIRNVGTEPISLRHVHSSALDLAPGHYDLQHFHGTWAREFNAERLSLTTARFTIESMRGTSSNAHNPYLAVMESGASETNGNCLGTTLVYSGNFAISAERGEFGRVRLLAGLNPFDFNWGLEPGEIFATPEVLHAFSGEGLGGLSHVWHDFIRAHVSPERFRNIPRPTYLNTWEAAYFDVNEDKVLDLADVATGIGVEMLVLDDGWFKGRTDDRRALGDWTADPDRFPMGIPALAEKVRAKGLKFGLWFEPEMVSPDSDLYRAHPDWAISVPGRTPSLGRNQMTLDFSKPEVVDHTYGQLDAILSSGQVGYVKWDMNRNMTEVGSGAKAHRYMLGLYGLLDRLMTAYPDILFETCASGGNRFDLGMLGYMAQGWVSDMCDPIGRLAIINGASHLFPTDVMAAYIGPSPNHQNGRMSSIWARFLAGVVCAARGVSLNGSDIAAHDDALTKHVRFCKATARHMLGARFDRLCHDDNETIWQQTSHDGGIVYVVAFQTLNAPNLPVRRARLRGLDPDVNYAVEGGAVYGGDRLMQHGIALTIPTEDFAAELLILQKVS